jgi:hypothetical protein
MGIGEDIVMETEECFNIELLYKEGENVFTFGYFYDIVLNQLKLKRRNYCLTSHIFYRLRSVLHKTFNINTRIYPERSMKSIIPRFNRRSNWSLLSQHLGLKLPDLERPFSLVIILSLITIFILSINLLGGFSKTINPLLACSFGFGSILFAYLSYVLSIPLAVNLNASKTCEVLSNIV